MIPVRWVNDGGYFLFLWVNVRGFLHFGSVLREDFKPESDIDVLVEFEHGKAPGFLKLAGMEEELSVLFGGRKVDLRTPQDLSRYFRDRVLKEAKVICR
ncbi:MAG: nucleotidyltransferase family protein [Dehalococcoidia bacterium]|nr:nucleotidyltransferase family protein [Dehalococcoidia bacterium]MDZ4247082.1 nucleotidyltransferase family protein [Dehalococcoidia bacterium]